MMFLVVCHSVSPTRWIAYRSLEASGYRGYDCAIVRLLGIRGLGKV